MENEWTERKWSDTHFVFYHFAIEYFFFNNRITFPRPCGFDHKDDILLIYEVVFQLYWKRNWIFAFTLPELSMPEVRWSLESKWCPIYRFEYSVTLVTDRAVERETEARKKSLLAFLLPQMRAGILNLIPLYGLFLDLGQVFFPSIFNDFIPQCSLPSFCVSFLIWSSNWQASATGCFRPVILLQTGSKATYTDSMCIYVCLLSLRRGL